MRHRIGNDSIIVIMHCWWHTAMICTLSIHNAIHHQPAKDIMISPFTCCSIRRCRNICMTRDVLGNTTSIICASCFTTPRMSRYIACRSFIAAVLDWNGVDSPNLNSSTFMNIGREEMYRCNLPTKQIRLTFQTVEYRNRYYLLENIRSTIYVLPSVQYIKNTHCTILPCPAASKEAKAYVQQKAGCSHTISQLKRGCSTVRQYSGDSV